VKPDAVVIPGLGTFTITDNPVKAGRVAGKIAVVTGAAQGFGLEISRQFAAAGAHVVLLDMNQAGATAKFLRVPPRKARLCPRSAGSTPRASFSCPVSSTRIRMCRCRPSAAPART
ncbi:MAG: SDR family NAD(P)-dependent oxidoreductase, partial [Spirochaetes bacterium]|nr:SDR family NAD(P)-dependent oxidoreductase [Spirochaetota bacterium]